MAEASSHATDEMDLGDISPDIEMADVEDVLAESSFRPQSSSKCRKCSAPIAESEFGQDTSGSTRSISEVVVEDVMENGRRYCNETYFMPNDEVEQTRLSIVHQIYLLTYDGRPTKSPLPDSASRILDIGTGPGDWPLAVAEERPNTEILAVDIGVFDSDAMEMAPENVYFQLDDIEHEWAHHDLFDFVHIRGMSGAIADWDALYMNAFRHLRPGGTIEVADTDFTSALLQSADAPANSYLSIYSAAVSSAAEVAGYPHGLDHLRTDALTAAGFVGARTCDINVPVGTWPTDPRDSTLGKMALIALLESLEAVSMRLLTKYLDWSPEQVRDLCEKVKMEIVTGREIMGIITVAVAKKPD